MNNKKTTRRALFSSLMSLLLCCSMLLGTTFAWFTDTVTSTGNIIKSGSLDVEMTWSDDNNTDETKWTDASEGAIFDYQYWEPGYTEVKYVSIKNVGDLAFRYQLNIVPDVKPVAGQFNLADVIDVYMAKVDNDGSTFTTFEQVKTYAAKVGTLAQLMADPDGAAHGTMYPAAGKGAPNMTVPADAVVGGAYYCIALHMQEEAGNDYQNLSVGEGFCVQLRAAQLTAEEDSFGPDYDVDSEYPVTAGGSAVAEEGKDVIVEVKDIKDADRLVAVLTIPAARAEKDTTVSAHVEEQASVDDAVWTVATQSGQAKSFDIHVDGLLDGTTPVEVKLFIGKGLKDPKVYHGKDGAYTEITPVSYSASSGYITFETADFSPFAVVYEKDLSAGTAVAWDGTADTSWYNDTDTEFTLTSAEALAGLAELVDGGNNFGGKTIKLDTDVDLADLPFNPIGHSKNGASFNGTFDGQGHTISNLYEQSNLDSNNGGWLYEGEYYGLFAYTNGAAIKNVTVADAYISSGRNEAAGVVGNAVDTAFSDITISNTTLIAYNNSAGGVAAECYGNCSFTNITVDEDTVIGPLWGTYDVRLGGVVGLVHAGNNVTFSDITVACQLDAINDVAANYQYWLYRYSGVLIGHVDGVNGVADPTGYVTCEDVTVIYGDWVNYHYCEDADLGAGSYNGPGEYKYARVEAGTGTNGIDLTACEHNEDESHNVLIVFDQLFGGGQGVKGLKTYDGVTVVYNNK